jgi:hypothetical protein
MQLGTRARSSPDFAGAWPDIAKMHPQQTAETTGQFAAADLLRTVGYG